MLSAGLGVPGAVQAQDEETEVARAKASFVINLLRFVEWPAGTFTDAHTPIVVGVSGNSLFARVLYAETRDKTIGGRPIEVDLYKKPEEALHCNVLFLGEAARKQIPAFLGAVQGTSILTIGETQDFQQLGGILQFALKDNTIHYRVNPETAQRVRIQISSKFLALAALPGPR